MAKGLELKIKSKELKEVFDKWQKLSDRAALKTPQFRTQLKGKFEEIFVEDLSKRFLSSPSTIQGGNVHGGAYWKTLSDAYLLKRPDRVTGKVLIDSTRLQKSFTVGSSELISEFSNQYEFKFGTKVDYAKKLQKTWPIVFLHRDLVNQLAKAYVDWLVLDLKEK